MAENPTKIVIFSDFGEQKPGKFLLKKLHTTRASSDARDR
jgi:hypothetical protein